MNSLLSHPACLLLAAYVNACYEVHTSTGAHHVRIGTSPEPALADRADWFIISAANPASWPARSTANAARQAELVSLVRAMRCPWHPARNAAADGGWPEESVAIRTTVAMADGLARYYGQSAIVHLPTDGCARLRCLRTDWRAAARAAGVDERFVDWLA